MDIFSAPHFRDDEAARKFLEGILWPSGPVCPHCGVIGHAYATKRGGVFRCAEKECHKDFSVTMKTVMERSHIGLHKWLQGFHLMTSSKKGISAHQLHRTLGITYRSAWFMCHRIREAMRAGGLSPLGGGGKTVEADETFIGRLEGVPKQHSGYAHKNVVLTLVERGGEARSFHVDSTSITDIIPIVNANVDRETAMMTDAASQFRNMVGFKSHEMVNHGAEEYVRGVIHTNTVEGYYSIFKRGMKGIYQHCSEKHLHRYLSEFDFRYSNRIALGVDDKMRASRAIEKAAGKRLTYQRPHQTKSA
jgi:transposase-like protein